MGDGEDDEEKVCYSNLLSLWRQREKGPPAVTRSLSTTDQTSYADKLRKVSSVDNVDELPKTKVQPPLGYIGTMALIASRRFSSIADLNLSPENTSKWIHDDSDADVQISKSWFDNLEKHEPEEMNIQDEIDGQISNSFGDIMEKYKSARAQILGNHEKTEDKPFSPAVIYNKTDNEAAELIKCIDKPETLDSTVDIKKDFLSPCSRLRRIGPPSSDISQTHSLQPIEENYIPLEDEPALDWSGNTDNLSALKRLTSKMNLSPERLNLSPERLNLSPERLNLSPERLNRTNLKTQISETTNVCELPSNDRINETRSCDVSSINKINEALSFIKKELYDMRQEDQILSKKLMYISKTLRDVRLERSCDEYRAMLDNTENDIVDIQKLESVSSICEVPGEMPLAPSLRHHGITKMNIGMRRFSVF